MYLDYAASTPVSKKVENKLYEVLSIFGNPSSQHDEGFKAQKIISDSKDIISSKINCKSNHIYFTSGATMSNNLAIQGFIRKHPDCKVLYSAIEHNDIILMAKYFGDKFIKIPVLNDGSISMNDLSYLLSKNRYYPILVVIQYANSEIGTIQNINRISQLVKAYENTYIYVDATQYIPYYKCDVEELKIDMLGMSGQKINCIKGTGILYINDLNLVNPIIFGEQGFIGGTENTLGIACLGEAFKNLTYNISELVEKRNYFIKKINRPIVGSLTNRLPNNIAVLFDNIKSEEFVELLNEYGIYVSAGSACSSGSLEPSHVLKEIGLSDKDAKSCIRFTINNTITYDDIDNTVDIINKLLRL